MGEYDVNEILSKDGLKHIDLGDGQSERFTSLKELIEENSKHKSWAKRIIDTSNSGYFQIATFVCQSEKGSGCRRHYHPDTDEWWVVIKGEIEFEIGDNEEKILGEPGDVIFCKKVYFTKYLLYQMNLVLGFLQQSIIRKPFTLE